MTTAADRPSETRRDPPPGSPPVLGMKIKDVSLSPGRLPPLPDLPWVLPLLEIASSMDSAAAERFARRRPHDVRFFELANDESGFGFDRGWWSVDVAVRCAVVSATERSVEGYDPRDTWGMPDEFVTCTRIFRGVALALYAPSSLSPETVKTLLAPLTDEMRDRLAINR